MSGEGALALVRLDPPSLLAIRHLRGPSPWKGGYARGMLRLGDGSLLLASHHRVMQLDPQSVAIQRIYTSGHFEDLHDLALHDGRVLVVSTYPGQILALDLEAGSVVPDFDRGDGHLRHPNNLCSGPHGALFMSCHGGTGYGSVWRVRPAPAEVVWDRYAGVPLRQVHSPVETDGGMIACEPGRGRLIAQVGWSVELGGWCRGILDTGDQLVVGVNPFREPRPDAVVSAPELVFISERKVQHRLRLGIGHPWQTFSIIPARSGDLGVRW